MLIKVCGIKDHQNYTDLVAKGINWIGLNFYNKSKRYVCDPSYFYKNNKAENTEHIGVFVNEEIENIKQIKEHYALDYIQLHGGEDVAFCKEVNTFSKVIKVFSIGQEFDFESLSAFDFCQMFLFDTQTPDFGGSGKKFDWTLIKQYKGDTPFLLAGGISLEDVNVIKSIKHPSFIGVDINSKFEDKPGFKNIGLVDNFKKEIDEYLK